MSPSIVAERCFDGDGCCENETWKIAQHFELTNQAMSDERCSVCNATDYSVVHVGARDDAELHTLLCKRCGLVYLPRPLEAGVVDEGYLSGDFSRTARNSLVPDKRKWKQSESMALSRWKYLDSVTGDALRRPGLRVIEVGCGLGSFLRLMKSSAGYVYGIEPDPSYAELGSTAYQLPIESSSYATSECEIEDADVVASFHVVEHVPQPVDMLEWMCNRVREGGTLYLECPALERPFEGDFTRFFWSKHLQTFSVKTLGGIVESLGFKVLDARLHQHALQLVARREGTRNSITLPLESSAVVAARMKSAKARHQWSRGIKKIPLSHYATKAIHHVRLRVTQREKSRPALATELSRRFNAAFESYPAQALGKIIHRQRSLFHFGLHHRTGNAGDTVLFRSVRWAIDKGRSQRWHRIEVRQMVTDVTVEQINRSAKAVIVGGGGLLLADTNANKESGWQWPCSIRHLKQLEVPLAFFAIGYNRFRCQDDFSDVFKENIVEMVKRSSFFALRNRGSIAALKQYLPKELHDRLEYQPCPTTVLSHLRPDAPPRSHRLPKRPLVCVNLAFDRHQLRFSGREAQACEAIARVLKTLGQQGWQIQLVAHCESDDTVLPWLSREQVDFEFVDLTYASAQKVISTYQAASLVIGMRGHSQMIPFGIGCPILSLVSHDKMAWFLEDIEHQEWGVEVSAEDFAEQLDTAVSRLVENYPDICEEVQSASSLLWKITQENVESLRTTCSI